VNGFVAPTDHGWYEFLRARPELQEINFWRPGGAGFAALRPGEPFFFKLKAPHHAIGGFGRFATFERMPLWRAWEVFGEANGTADLVTLRLRTRRLAASTQLSPSQTIGCIVLESPVFLAPEAWVPVPADWKQNIVSGRRYELDRGPGRAMWEACLARAGASTATHTAAAPAADGPRYGRARLVIQRRGQEQFRDDVYDAYGGACAVTGERTKPVLDAAHIYPYGKGGSHDVSNGILLRRDLHCLFDLGYVTVRPDGTFAVSRQLRADWPDGRPYDALDGCAVWAPARADHRPDQRALAWRAASVFLG
jgi:putative restriction endonuclease